MTALEHPTPMHVPRAPRQSDVPTPARPDRLRLRWREPGVADGFVDGGWWPHSLDLSVELPPLLAAFQSAGYEVTRVVYHPAQWGPAPRALTGAGRVVRLDRKDSQEPTVLSRVDAAGATRTDLIVIPPRTAQRVAERVLALAPLGGDLHRLTGILDRAEPVPSSVPGHSLSADSQTTATWETDGGRTLAA